MTATVTEKNTKADILAAYNALAAKHDKLVNDIVTIGGETAADHDWCEVFEETLDRIGIERPEIVIRASIAQEVEVSLDAVKIARLGYNAHTLTEKDAASLLRDYVDEHCYGDFYELTGSYGVNDQKITEARIA